MDSIRWLLLIVLALIGSVWGVTFDDPYAAQRRRMVRTINADVKATSARLGEPELEARVLDAMGSVPRHEFVPSSLRHLAYANRPLPIGYGQTISQPYIVAVMTALLDVDNEDIVLEVGTSSGYQAAVLAELVQRVYSIEIISELVQRTQKQLRRLGCDNISFGRTTSILPDSSIELQRCVSILRKREGSSPPALSDSCSAPF